MAEQRKGTITVYDSSVNLWEEAVAEPSFKAEVMEPLIRFLRETGWSVRRDEEVHKRWRILSPKHRHCRRGDLEAKLSLSGCHLKFEMFQNVANVENPNGGQYDFSRMRRMPYLLRKAAELSQRRIVEFLTRSYGYSVSPPRVYPGVGGPRALDWVLDQIRSCEWHYKPELDRCDWHNDGNRESADGALLDHGQEVWLADSKGRWLRGRAFYDLNNMWWVVLGPYAWTKTGSFYLYTRPPVDARLRENTKTRRRRLREELDHAVKREDFERAILLRDIIRRETPPSLMEAA